MLGSTLQGSMTDGSMTDGGMMAGSMMGGMGIWMLLWALVGIAVIALAVEGVASLLSKNDSSRPATSPPGESAQELLRRRYAAGEIDEDEFHRRRSELS